MQKALVIFDMDGVITETTHEHFQAWTLLFKKHFGINLNPNFETYTKGVSRLESLKILLSKSGIHITDESKILELAHEKNEVYKHLIKAFNPSNVLPGVLELIYFLKKHNIKIALGSASRNGGFLLDCLKLTPYFDYIVDPEGLKSKPEPDIFLTAMNYFHLEPQQCIGIEDAEAGILAIKKAHMYAIGVGSETLLDADWKVKDLATLDYLKLKELLKNSYEEEPKSSELNHS